MIPDNSNSTDTVSRAVPGEGALQILGRRKGRALSVDAAGTLYVSDRYRVLCSHDDGRTWASVGTLPYAPLRRMARFSRLASRLLRIEVRALCALTDGGFAASNREGVFFLPPGERTFRASRVDAGDVPAWPPMTISPGPAGRILWGEYGANREKRSVRIFASDDNGRTYACAYAFAPGETRHIHNIYYDAGLERYWVLTGDHGHEPGIGLLSTDLRTFDWVVKGDQTHRAVCLFDLGDRIVYGTDTEMAPNAVMSLEKATGRLRRVAETDGSCIYGCRFGDVFAITTSVEPSAVNPCRDAKLLLSRDAETWHEVYAAPKDGWNENYFQFGSINLPRGRSGHDTIVLSGQALRGIDNVALICRWREPA
ncbi:MAG TPA: hypothetical protein P5572_01050 [Phycisphaerae bacterium]|nr:hypothetical protein [Phycisphaerae bacterium]